jgi:peptidoglycan/LPS O-acetylase OafA/YrhL
MRFARIVPLLVLLLGVLSALHLAHVEHFVVSAKTGGLPRALLAALTFHVNVLEARRGYLPGNWDILWSLSVEEVFYVFFPLVARIFGRGKLFVVVLLGFVALGPFARTVFTQGNETWKEYSYLGGMDAIALGCLTALVVSRIQFSRIALRVLWAAGAVLLVFSLCFSLLGNAWGLERSGLDMTVIAAGTCLVIAAVAQSGGKAPRVLGPLLRLGERSYEVYLTHMFVVLWAFGLFVRAGKPMWAVPWLFIGVIVMASLLGEMVARFYSEPLNRAIRERWQGGKRAEDPGIGPIPERAEP